MKKIIVANWKMSPASIKEAKKIFNDTKKTANKLRKVETVICPPFVYLSELGHLVSKGTLSVRVGAQDVFWQENGSYTGEISVNMLKNLGAKYVILGHSERRQNLNETDEMVNKKIKTALKNDLKVVFCVGEKERDENYLRFIKNEIIEGLKNISRNLLDNLIIVYEPIWAIGKSGEEADTPENVFQMGIYIRRILLPLAGEKLSRNIPVLYGGSVDVKNCLGFLKEGNVQGLLVGRKSLNSKEFKEILKIAEYI